MATQQTETDEQYKQICDGDSCDRVLCENTPIMCYMNKEEGDKTLCQMCYDGGYEEDDENPDNFESDDEEDEELKCVGFRPQTRIGECAGCKAVCEECENLMIVEDTDTDSEDKREGDYYIVRHEECIYDKEGEVSGMETLNEEEFDSLSEAREIYNDYEIEPYGELVYLDMIICDGEDQENIDCKGTMKKE